jgi:TolA-binding protein
MPSIKLEKKNFDTSPVRDLASVLQASSSDGLFAQYKSESLYRRGQKSFSDKLYEEAIADLAKLITDYPESPWRIRAHYLLIESLVQLNRDEQVVKNVEQMVAQYPEDELTGFALLQLAKLYQRKEHFEEAEDLYKIIEKNFSNQEIITELTKNKRVMP